MSEPIDFGSGSSSDLFEYLRSGECLPSDDIVLSLRSVGVRGQSGVTTPYARWIFIRSRARTAFRVEHFQAAEMDLWSSWIAFDDLSEVAGLEAFSDSWMSGTNTSIEAINAAIQWQRIPGWKVPQVGPHWLGSWNRPIRSHGNAHPRGPFFNHDHTFFGSSLVDAAVQWIEYPEFSGQNGFDRDVKFVLEDPRARISNISRADDGSISVNCAIQAGLACVLGVIWRNQDGATFRFRETIQGQLSVPMNSDAVEVELFLLSRNGFCFDRYRESDSEPRHRHFSVLRQLGPDKSTKELIERIESGENENTEFKEFVQPSQSDDKCKELIRTVCSFANTAGGSLFIGVSDRLEIVGIDSQLRRVYKSEATEELRLKYSRELLQAINAALVPVPGIKMEWRESSSQHVLEIEVEKLEGGIMTYVEAHESLIRRGASNRRITGLDM